MHEKLTKFLAKMGGAALYVVNEEDALVQQVGRTWSKPALTTFDSLLLAVLIGASHVASPRVEERPESYILVR